MQKPIFSIVAVLSLDGRIARDSKHFTGWSSREDKEFLHSFLDNSDVVVVGRNTWVAARHRLSKRNCVVFTSKVDGVVVKGENLVFFNPRKSDFFDFVSKSGFVKVAVLGGSMVFSYFLDNGLVDNIYLTVEPLVFGSGLCLFDSKFEIRKFNLVSFKRLNSNGSLLLHYSRQ
jgi:dihydrofolate reductase